MDDNARKFAKRFGDILYEKRMTAADISKKTGISEASMSKYRKGIHIPQGQNLKAIADALNVTVDYLLGSDGSMTMEEMKGYVWNRETNPTLLTPELSSESVNYELNIIEKLPYLTEEAKQLISQTVDALIKGNQQNLRFVKAYFDALNRIQS